MTYYSMTILSQSDKQIELMPHESRILQEDQTIDDSLLTIQETDSSNYIQLQETKSIVKRIFAPIKDKVMRGAILTLLAAAMGTGIFNLPLRVSQIGVLPFVAFVFAIGLYSYFGMKMISEMIVKQKMKSYSQMAQKSYGMALRRVSQFCLIVYPWGNTICFQVIIAKFSTQLLNDIFGAELYENRELQVYNSTGIYKVKKGNLVRILLNIAVISLDMVFILKRQIKTIKKLAIIGVFAIILNFLIVVCTSMAGFTRIQNQSNQEVVYHGIFKLSAKNITWFQFQNVQSISTLFQGMAAIFFCYVSHQLIFPLSQDLKNPSQRIFNNIFKRTISIQIIVYMFFALSAYFLLMEHEDIFSIQAMAITSITTSIMSFGKFIMVIALFVIIPLNMYPARVVFTQAFQIDTSRNKNHILVCVGFAVSSCSIAILFQKINSYFGLLGGTAGVMMAGGIPALCYLKMMRCKRNEYLMLAYIAIMTSFAFSGAILSVADPK